MLFMKVALITHNIYLEHNPYLQHPESKGRPHSIIESIMPIREKLIYHEAIPASIDQLSTVHAEEYINNIKRSSIKQISIDSDIYCSTWT